MTEARKSYPDGSDSCRAPILGIARHRIGTDGFGVRTLVGFHGCPLRCRYCLNPQSLSPTAPVVFRTPEELYREVAIDRLYFLATGGGVTFGGGEPLLQSDFLRRFRSLCGKEWNNCAETSLNVPWEAVEAAADAIDGFTVDIKDTDPAVYRAYTGKDNTAVLDNLRRLLALVGPERVTVRVPLMEGYNTEEAQRRSETLLRDMGVTHFDFFRYRVPLTDGEKCTMI